MQSHLCRLLRNRFPQPETSSPFLKVMIQHDNDLMGPPKSHRGWLAVCLKSIHIYPISISIWNRVFVQRCNWRISQQWLKWWNESAISLQGESFRQDGYRVVPYSRRFFSANRMIIQAQNATQTMKIHEITSSFRKSSHWLQMFFVLRYHQGNQRKVHRFLWVFPHK